VKYELGFYIPEDAILSPFLFVSFIKLALWKLSLSSSRPFPLGFAQNCHA
jgi:hypothetical protein